MEINKIYYEDCLTGMQKIDDSSIDMILCDLPYGTTACKWDTIIPFEPLWEQYKRISKHNCAIVLTASQPFTSALVMSNPKMFKCEWIWQKAVGSNFAVVKYQPLKEHEDILVFSKGTPKYYPIREKRNGSGENRLKNGYKSNPIAGDFIGNLKTNRAGRIYDNLKNPGSVQFFNNREKCRGLHPTQKPVALMEYLIKTYSLENDLILDNCIGSGTTAIACINTGRNFIGFENDEKYWKTACERVELHYCNS